LKLSVGSPQSPLEREADQVAAALVAPERRPARPPCVGCSQELQRQPTEDMFQISEEDEERDRAVGTIQTKQALGGGAATTPGIEGRLSDLRGSGRRLPAAVRASFEPRLGHDLANVRVHTDSRADQVARALHARAFTWGNQIAFRTGEYQPDQPAGSRLLAHELAHVIQQGSAPRTPGGRPTAAPSLTTRPLLQRKDCNFFVYDSTETSAIGTAWKYGALARATPSRGGYVIASSDTIEYMLSRLLRTYADKDCDCIEEIQFWSHGSPGNAMSIAKTDDEITAADFAIPGLDRFGDPPSVWEMARNPAAYQEWERWFNSLTWRQQLLVKVRYYLCGPDAEVYYRSCSAFQGKTGQEFAQKSATFWRSKVIGHTKLIGLTQPGRHTLSPGERPDWPESEGETTEMKKQKQKQGTTPKKL
jgi:hypothetical protein